MIKKRALLLGSMFVWATGNLLFGHCDGVDGPVVRAGLESLKTSDLKPALIWIQPGGEKELTEAFEKTSRVRQAGAEARELADSYFLETLVRLHRMGEGEAYTGLKPAGRDVGPVVKAFDQALETGSQDQLLALFPEADRAAIRNQFLALWASKQFDPENVNAGRSFVARYVKLLHHLQEIGAGGAHQHPAAPERASVPEAHCH